MATDPLTHLFGVSGLNVLITGAGTGIGKCIALTLAAAGANIAVTDRDADAAEQVAQSIHSHGGNARALAIDVNSEQSIIDGINLAVEALGCLDVLVNNAGIFPKTPILSTSGDDWDQLFTTNTRGTFLCLREAARHMTQHSRAGRIINIASMGGVRSSFAGRSAYNASKAAVMRLTAEAALEFAARRITVNAILPGPIATEAIAAADQRGSTLRSVIEKQIPLGRMGTPEDIAAAVIYLSSTAGQFITGHNLVVDGGALLV